MTTTTRKRIVIAAIAIGLLAALVYGFLPRPIPVQTAAVERATLRVTVEEEGETRVTESFTIVAPVPGILRRIALEVGDRVAQNQPVAILDAPEAGPLDTRTRAELAARLAAAGAAHEGATVLAAYARSERERIEQLHAAGSASEQARDRARAEAEQADAARRAAEADVRALRIRLEDGRGANEDAATPVELRAPVAGRVLAVHRPSAGPVQPGEPLLEIGDTERLKVTVDLRTQDAVRLRPGTRAELIQWGRDDPLAAEVTRIGPSGFAAVSALGVEERRVPIDLRIVSPREAWTELGAGYRVLARFILWESDDVLQVPAAALFRTDDGPAVFVIREGRAVRTLVETGREAGLRVQVRAGIGEDDRVVVHPSNDIEDGIRIVPR